MHQVMSLACNESRMGCGTDSRMFIFPLLLCLFNVYVCLATTQSHGLSSSKCGTQYKVSIGFVEQ